MAIKLFDYQEDALKRMKNGCILCGSVGSGKSRTSISYYFCQQGGDIHSNRMMQKPKDLYIITTAKKRDSLEWEEELVHFLISTNPKKSLYSNKVVIDSWNNITKYRNVTDSFFIFDEQKLVSFGAWTNTFLKIAKSNEWILLSATPGDKWEDYIPIFIANGFYRNKTDFAQQHLVYSRFSKFPKVERYINTGRLIRLRKNVLIQMDYEHDIRKHNIPVMVTYDKNKYKIIFKDRWNVEENEPIENASQWCYELRKCVNSDISRLEQMYKIVNERNRAIIFYNYDYELELIKDYISEVDETIEIAEWNGHKHQEIPDSKRWIYLVQYNAGSEGWNCIKTDTIIFFSQNYSYRIMIQSAGRIDRLNTPYKDLYYYHLRSSASIDNAIFSALTRKKKFNESAFFGNRDISKLQKTA